MVIVGGISLVSKSGMQGEPGMRLGRNASLRHEDIITTDLST